MPDPFQRRRSMLVYKRPCSTSLFCSGVISAHFDLSKNPLQTTAQSHDNTNKNITSTATNHVLPPQTSPALQCPRLPPHPFPNRRHPRLPPLPRRHELRQRLVAFHGRMHQGHHLRHPRHVPPAVREFHRHGQHVPVRRVGALDRRVDGRAPQP